jgi:protein-S-isoprenylcysteine O-methyltransferase Ste14
MDIYHLIVVAAWAAFLLVWFVSAFNTKRTVSLSWRSLWWRVGMIAAIALLAASGGHETIQFATFTATSPNAFLESLGALICVIGVAFAIWARLHLGRNWGMPMSFKENPDLVSSGPYAYVRHPIYTGVLTAMLGAALVAGPFWLLPFVFFGLYFNFAATKEEARMLETFPATYPAYKKRTKKLIPFVF